MRYAFSRSLLILFVASSLAGCSDGNQSVEEQPVAENDVFARTSRVRHCFRNEYPFEGEPDKADIESLTIEIRGDRAVGEYNWLPAFKDKRVGRFEGSYDGQSTTATYKYIQEGQLAVATISITLEPTQAVVEGGSPELGLNVTIAKVDCLTE